MKPRRYRGLKHRWKPRPDHGVAHWKWRTCEECGLEARKIMLEVATHSDVIASKNISLPAWQIKVQVERHVTEIKHLWFLPSCPKKQ